MASEQTATAKQEKLKKLMDRISAGVNPVFLVASIGVAVWGMSLALIAYHTGNKKLALVQVGSSVGGACAMQRKRTGVARVLDEADDLLEVKSEEQLEKEVDQLVDMSLTQAIDTVSVFMLTFTAPIWVALPIIIAAALHIKAWIVTTVFVALFAPMLAFCIAVYERAERWVVKKLKIVTRPAVDVFLDGLEENHPLL